MAVIKFNLIIASRLSKDELLNKIKRIGKDKAQRPTLLLDEDQYDVTVNENHFSIKQKPFYETLSLKRRNSLNEVNGKIEQYKDQSKIHLRIDFSNSVIFFFTVLVPIVTFVWVIHPDVPLAIALSLPLIFFASFAVYAACIKNYWIRFFSTCTTAALINNKKSTSLKSLIAFAIFNTVISLVVFMLSLFNGVLNDIFVSAGKMFFLIGIFLACFLTGFLMIMLNSYYFKLNLLEIIKGFSSQARFIISILLINGIFHLILDPNPITISGNVFIRNSQWRSFSSILLYLNFTFMSVLFMFGSIARKPLGADQGV